LRIVKDFYAFVFLALQLLASFLAWFVCYASLVPSAFADIRLSHLFHYAMVWNASCLFMIHAKRFGMKNKHSMSMPRIPPDLVWHHFCLCNVHAKIFGIIFAMGDTTSRHHLMGLAEGQQPARTTSHHQSAPHTSSQQPLS